MQTFLFVNKQLKVKVRDSIFTKSIYTFFNLAFAADPISRFSMLQKQILVWKKKCYI